MLRRKTIFACFPLSSFLATLQRVRGAFMDHSRESVRKRVIRIGNFAFRYTDTEFSRVNFAHVARIYIFNIFYHILLEILSCNIF
jgi:hypothetical protein